MDRNRGRRIHPAAKIKEQVENHDLFSEFGRRFPVQVKPKDKPGRPDIDAYEMAMEGERRNKGLFISFHFPCNADTEIKRAFWEPGLEIIPITVDEGLSEGTNDRA